jgi:hypothetical protein
MAPIGVGFGLWRQKADVFFPTHPPIGVGLGLNMVFMATHDHKTCEHLS